MEIPITLPVSREVEAMSLMTRDHSQRALGTVTSSVGQHHVGCHAVLPVQSSQLCHTVAGAVLAAKDDQNDIARYNEDSGQHTAWGDALLQHQHHKCQIADELNRAQACQEGLGSKSCRGNILVAEELTQL